MKIAILGSRGYPFVYSGYETFVSELVSRLKDQNFEITVYCHKSLFKDKPSIVNGIHLKYIPAIENKILSQLSNSFLATMHVVFSKNEIVFFVNSANGPFGLITKIFRKKTVINVDGLEWLRPKWKGLGALYFKWASKLATVLFDEIITDSTEMQKIYKELFNADSTMIAYGANVRYSKKPELISKWNLQINNYFLIVGRLVQDNNADVLIKEFIKSSSNKKLVVVGDVPYKDEYAESIKALKDERLVFTGYVNNQDELAELYHNCFVYFHGHEFGGTNPTMLKALAYGCAVFALETRFNREMLENGKFGYFFSKEENSLSNLINKFEKEPSTLIELRKISRERIEQNYTWDKIVDQYKSLFERMEKE